MHRSSIRSPVFLASKSQLLLCSHLLHLLARVGLHLAALARLARHRHRALGVRKSILKSIRAGVHLTRDDDRVDYLTFWVVHGQHVEPAATDVLRINDGVQKPTRPVRAPHDEGRAVRHVPAKVRHHLGLFLGRHANKRGEEDHVVLAEHIGQCGDVGGVEGHACAQVLVRAEQLLRALVGGAAHVVVVELRVRQARDVADQELVLQLAKVDVVAEVREAAEVVERVVEAGEQVGVVRLELPLGVGAEADELFPHLLCLGVELCHVDRARRDAGHDEVGEQRVDFRGWAQGRQLGDGSVEAGDLLHQGRNLHVLGLHWNRCSVTLTLEELASSELIAVNCSKL
ncbi:hypothetical protein EJB05_06914, partial [Eragrostis curvula]